MFAKLFLESDADDLPPEEDRRRRAPVPAGHGRQARHRGWEHPPRP